MPYTLFSPSIGSQTSTWWSQIREQRLENDFAENQKKIEILKQLKIEDIRTFYSDIISKAARMVVTVRGKLATDDDFEESEVFQNFTKITDPQDFIQNQALYSAIPIRNWL